MYERHEEDSKTEMNQLRYWLRVLGIVGTGLALLTIQALRRRDPRASEGRLGAYVEHPRRICDGRECNPDQSASEVSSEGKVIRLSVLIFTANAPPLATLLSKRLFSAVPGFAKSGYSERQIHLENSAAFGRSASGFNAPAWDDIASLQVSICATAQVTR
jgi:hypothetical protein